MTFLKSYSLVLQKLLKILLMGWQGGLLLEWSQLTEFQELEAHTRW